MANYVALNRRAYEPLVRGRIFWPPVVNRFEIDGIVGLGNSDHEDGFILANRKHIGLKYAMTRKGGASHQKNAGKNTGDHATADDFFHLYPPLYLLIILVLMPINSAQHAAMKAGN